MEIKGKFTNAIVYSNSVEEYAVTQIKNILDNDVAKDSKVCIMPDVHPGYVVPIGFTMTVKNKILPNIVGIDIGCGMTVAKISKHRGMEFKKLDSIIRENIPSGFEIRDKCHRFASGIDFNELECKSHIQKDKANLSLCTLGGGNHFIEIDKDEDNNFYIVVHSGSRHLGKEVTDFYLREGKKILQSKGKTVPYELTYIENQLMADYINDVKSVQHFAQLNRLAIIDEIVKGMKWKTEEPFSSVHNYIESFDGAEKKYLIRKGAVSAKENENIILPINMKDGIILGKGKGNPDWNFSAPHGAGRVMKREDVKKSFTVSSFKSEMKGIYSSCISPSTLDEAPFAYRRMEEILESIQPTVEILKILRPVYNFKAGGES